MTNRPIGVFDSGVGGLTVLKRLTQEMSNENFIYFGDTARVPYGEKTPEQLLMYSKEILNWLDKHNVKAVVMACNTSSAITYELLKDKYKFPVLGLIHPTADYISSLNLSKVGVIATSATVNSKAYSKAIIKQKSDLSIYEVACPGFVEIVESGDIDSKNSKQFIKKSLDSLIKKNVDKIVLGCTHYPYLVGVINDLIKKPDILIDPAYHLVSKLQEILETNNLRSKQNVKGEVAYYVSSSPSDFVNAAKNFYPECNNAHLLDISCLNFSETQISN